MRSLIAMIVMIAACSKSEPEIRALYARSNGVDDRPLEDALAGRMLFYTNEEPTLDRNPIKDSQYVTLLNTQGGGHTGLFAVTIRYYVIGYPARPCYVQFGPGYHEEPIDLGRLLQFIEDPELRDAILGYLQSIDPRRWHRFETVIDGVAVKSERVVSSETGAIWTMSIDACRRHDNREDVAIYGRGVL